MENLKICFLFVLTIWVYILTYIWFSLIDKNKENFTYKDGQVLYELCRKKTWSQTNFILKSYWEADTEFKNYLLNK